MAKNTTSAAETTTRKPRTPRALSPLELEAKAQLDDAKALAAITPEIDKLGPWGREKLNAHIAGLASPQT